MSIKIITPTTIWAWASSTMDLGSVDVWGWIWVAVLEAVEAMSTVETTEVVEAMSTVEITEVVEAMQVVEEMQVVEVMQAVEEGAVEEEAVGVVAEVNDPKPSIF
jgi:hypothetical protein